MTKIKCKRCGGKGKIRGQGSMPAPCPSCQFKKDVEKSIDKAIDEHLANQATLDKIKETSKRRGRPRVRREQ